VTDHFGIIPVTFRKIYMDRIPEARTVSPAEVRVELERILDSGSFRNGTRLSRLLRYVVESSLDGLGETLKEYTLGAEVFERGKSFDPRLDGIVRSTVRNIRFKLDEYYKTEGSGDPVFIELPKGGYVPSFRYRQPVTAASSSPKAGRQLPLSWRTLAAAGLLSVVGAGVTAGYLSRGRAGPSPDSLVVLPFDNLGNASGQPMADSLTEDLTDAFVRTPGLRVIARTSAVTAHGRSGDIRSIGQDLKVAAVLRGSVESFPDKVRINVQLAGTADGRPLWSGSYETAHRDIAVAERNIVRAAGATLRLPIPESAVPHETTSVEAHDLYIQGRYLWYKRDWESVRQSIASFQAALEKDANYALAYIGLADAYSVLAGSNGMPSGTALPLAKEAASRAVALSPDSAAAHASLGLIKNTEWDWKAAERELRRALELNPGYAPTYQRLAFNDTVHGRFAEAEGLLREAQTLDPQNWMITYNLAENAYYARRNDEAIAYAGKLLDTSPALAKELFARAYYQKGMIAEARAAIGREDFQAVRLYNVSFMADRKAGAQRFLQVSSDFPQDVLLFLRACVAARLGLKDESIAWLEKAYARHDPDLCSLRIDPDMDPLRTDPRYRDLLSKVGLTD